MPSRSWPRMSSKSSRPRPDRERSEIAVDPFGKMLSKRRRRSLRGRERRSLPLSHKGGKRDVGGRPWAPQEIIELRPVGFVGCDHLAIENDLVDAEFGRHLLTQSGKAIEDIAAP